ncbi:6397_t:CDS:2, partial [Gigaspora margarita]
MAQENYDSTVSESSDYSSYSFEQSLDNKIELKEGNFYNSHEAFVIAVKNYTKQQGFQVCLEKYKKNAVGQHNHSMVLANHQRFTYEKRLIPIEVQQRIMLLRCARYNIPTIHAILKEEFDDKNLKHWALCYNRQMFMANITTTQRGESMNNLIKGYLDTMTSLTVFLKAFESALEQRKEATEFTKYQKKNEIIKLVTSSPYKKQASDDDIEITFQVERFQSQAHSLASQLNLEELPQYLFFLKWRKDPNERTLIRTYKTFYNTKEDNDDYEYLLKRTWQKVQDIINTKPEMAKSFYNSFDKILQEEIKAHVSDNNS